MAHGASGSPLTSLVSALRFRGRNNVREFKSEGRLPPVAALQLIRSICKFAKPGFWRHPPQPMTTFAFNWRPEMFFKPVVLISLMLAPIHLFAQQTVVTQKQKDAAAAAEELEAVIIEARKLDDKLAMFDIQSRAAMLVSLSDPARSDLMFQEIWKFASQQTDKDFEKDKALALILKHLYPRNPKLAREFLAQQSSADESSLEARSSGRDPGTQREAKLASQLVATDPSAAAELLERALSTSVTPAALGALNRLRERDPLLSDFVVLRALDGLRNQPTVVSLTALHLLSSYVFPDVSSGAVDAAPQSLQSQYFSTTYDVLKASLAESEAALSKDQRYTQAALRLRAIYQGQVAIILSALAPRYQPGLFDELDQFARTLSANLPPNVLELSKFTASRLSGNQVSATSDTAIPLAISTGDFAGATKMIDELKNETVRNGYSQLLAKSQAKTLLGQGDVVGALTMIRKVQDQNARLAFYLQAIKVTHKKRDAVLSNLVINEARILIPQVDRNGLQIRALFSFAAELAALRANGDAIEFLASAVSAVNALPKKTDEPSAIKSPAELAMSELNDPRSLLEAEELGSAFVSVGTVDLSRATAEAKRIQMKPVQLVARLEAVQDTLKRTVRTPKPPVKRSTAPASTP